MYDQHDHVYRKANLSKLSNILMWVYWFKFDLPLSLPLLATLDNQAVIIHGHSVKGIEQVVCHENANETSSWISTSKRRNAIWCRPELAIICAHLSHVGYAVHLLPERGFSYRVCDEEMPNLLLVLTLLKIISRYQWYISLSISYTYR